MYPKCLNVIILKVTILISRREGYMRWIWYIYVTVGANLWKGEVQMTGRRERVRNGPNIRPGTVPPMILVLDFAGAT